MARHDSVTAVEGFDPAIPVADAFMPPSHWYTSERLHTLERTAVFHAGWVPVARRDAVAEPGAYLAGCCHGEPFLLTRDGAGALHALSNTCRHKGREVVLGRGRTQEQPGRTDEPGPLVCGYHGWRYDLDGRLRAAPRSAGMRGFDREAMSLPALRAATWGPWIWLNLDGRAPDLQPQLRGLEALLDQTGWRSLRPVAARSFTLACNWKVYVDNYLDGGYHLTHMHPALSAQLDMDSYRTELFERYSVQSVRSQPTGAASAARMGARALYAWIYPNVMLNRYGDCLDTNLVVPLGPERCRVDDTFFFADGVPAERIDSSIEESAVTQHEDGDICASVQRGLRSVHYERGRYAPEVEHGEHHFHCLLAEDYRRAQAP